jgi:hypothetical protein
MEAAEGMDRRTDCFLFLERKRFAVSAEGRNKARVMLEKAGFTETEALEYIRLLDNEYMNSCMQKKKEA